VGRSGRSQSYCAHKGVPRSQKKKATRLLCLEKTRKGGGEKVERKGQGTEEITMPEKKDEGFQGKHPRESFGNCRTRGDYSRTFLLDEAGEKNQ